MDSFRYFYPDLEGAYSWWSYRFQARAKNAGWRIDYFVVSKDLMPKIEDAKIYSEALGSDQLHLFRRVSASLSSRTSLRGPSRPV